MSNINDFDNESKARKRWSNLVLMKDVCTQGRHLSEGAFRLYVALLTFRNNGTGRTFPAREKLIERSGLGERTFRNARAELIEFCWLGVKRNLDKSNDYEVTRPIRWAHKQEGILAEDQVCPTEAEAEAWRQRLREKRSLKEPRRTFAATTDVPHAGGYKADPAWYNNDPDAWPDQVGDEEFADIPF